MPLLICRQRVADFERWKRVFDSHAAAQRASGLHLERIFRNLDDPNDVVALFRVTDLEGARKFVTSPDVPKAQEESSLLGKPALLPPAMLVYTQQRAQEFAAAGTVHAGERVSR